MGVDSPGVVVTLAPHLLRWIWDSLSLRWWRLVQDSATLWSLVTPLAVYMSISLMVGVACWGEAPGVGPLS